MEDLIDSYHASSLLNCSHAYVLGLAERGELEAVGSTKYLHRWFRRDDVLQLKVRLREERSKILDELVQLAQEDGWYDFPNPPSRISQNTDYHM